MQYDSLLYETVFWLRLKKITNIKLAKQIKAGTKQTVAIITNKTTVAQMVSRADDMHDSVLECMVKVKSALNIERLRD